MRLPESCVRPTRRILVVEDEEQLDKALEVRADVPTLSHVVIIDTRGIRLLADPTTISLDALENLGEAPTRDVVDLWGESIGVLRGGDQLATILITSGESGPPRGVLVSHAALLAAARIFTEGLGVRRDEEVLSYLPLCHVTERVVSVAAAIDAGYVVNFGEGGELFVNDLCEVQPTVFVGVPRVWARLMVSVQVGIRNTSPLKRRVFQVWHRHGIATGAARRRGQRRRRLGEALGWLFLYRNVRRKFGLARVRIALSALAPIAPDAVEFWWSLGVPLRETYGQTEDLGFATANPRRDVRVGTAGTALPGVELRVDRDGEVLVRSEAVFAGYLGDELASRSAFTEDGWMRTGDLGTLDGRRVPDNHRAARRPDRHRGPVVLPDRRREAPDAVAVHLRRDRRRVGPRAGHRLGGVGDHGDHGVGPPRGRADRVAPRPVRQPGGPPAR